LEEANVNREYRVTTSIGYSSAYLDAFIACPLPHAAALKDYIQSASSTMTHIEIQSYEPELGAWRIPTTGILRKLANHLQVVSPLLQTLKED